MRNTFRIIALASVVFFAPASKVIVLRGETGGRAGTPPLTIVQADPHHPGTLLAGTAAALLFRSRDGAATWSPLPFPMSLRCNLHAILIDPQTPDVYLVALSSENPQYAGVFRSADGGATWTQLRGLEQKQVWALARWTADARVIAAGTQEGVFLTRDGGDSWTRLSSSRSAWPRPVVSLAFDPTDRNTLYAGTPHLAWKTANGGATWQRIRGGMEEDSDIFSIVVDASRRTHLLAGACSGIYRSLDGGGTWSNLEQAVGGALRTYVIARPPGRPNIVFAGTSGGLMQSPDGGATWRRLSEAPVRSIAFDPGDSLRTFVATDHGILRSEDGTHFVVASHGLDKR